MNTAFGFVEYAPNQYAKLVKVDGMLCEAQITCCKCGRGILAITEIAIDPYATSNVEYQILCECGKIYENYRKLYKCKTIGGIAQ